MAAQLLVDDRQLGAADHDGLTPSVAQAVGLLKKLLLVVGLVGLHAIVDEVGDTGLAIGVWRHATKAVALEVPLEDARFDRALGGKQTDCRAGEHERRDALRGLFHDVDHRDLDGLVDVVVEVVGGIARNGDIVRASLLKPAGNLGHLRARVGFCVVEDVSGAVGNLRIVEHDHGHVVLVGTRGRLLDEKFHEVRGGKGAHATKYAKNGFVHVVLLLGCR